MIEERGDVAQTLHDRTTGEPFGAILGDGSRIQASEDYQTAWAWDDVTATKIPWVVVWHGGRTRGDWSRTKGELLGDYARLPEVFRFIGIPGPIAKNASRGWARFQVREADEGGEGGIEV